MRTTTGNSGLGCYIHRTALILIISLGFCYWPSRYIRRKHWSNHLRATKLWSRSHSCALFSSPMACSASCSFFRCNMFFMPSSCQHTTHSLCPAPVNRQHVLYALLLSTDMFFMPSSCQQTYSLCPAPVNRHVLYVQLLSTNMFFMQAPVNSRILYAQLLLTDTFFVYDPCQRTTHSLCTAPINSQ